MIRPHQHLYESRMHVEPINAELRENLNMKKIVVALLFFGGVISLHAQDTVWRKGGMVALNFSQVSLTNWAAGGQNSIAGNALVNYFSNFKKGRVAWDNYINLGYGLLVQGKKGSVLKSDDNIDIGSKYGLAASKNWYYSALANFRSQFAPGYSYPNDSVVISRFLAPAYLTFALGMDYKPSNSFSLFLSPLSSRFLFVTDKRLSDAGAFGVDPGEKMRTELGALLKATYNKEMSSVVSMVSTLDLYSNYLRNPGKIDVNWQMLVGMKISRFFSASISTQLLYDYDTKLTFYKDDGITVDHVGPGIQFKEVLGIGFSYRFAGFTVR
jgi:hypothetical protein